eukprot:7027_1
MMLRPNTYSLGITRSVTRLLCSWKPKSLFVRRNFRTTSLLYQKPENEIEVFVNDVSVSIPNGATVMYACEKAGIEIPRFCYHDRLSIAGNCRMCLVEVERTPKPVASCAMPAVPGMKIHTDTPVVKNAREGVMEFLLVNHPLDCPICDQGGECDLQDQSAAFGSGVGRFEEDKRAVEDKYFGPLIATSMNRCILCTRCVRFAEEICNFPSLGITGRGLHSEVGTYVETIIDSELSGNLIDLCPVGALTNKQYSFTARPWELNHTESIDVMDALGSNITIDTRGMTVLRMKPRINEDVNEEWISDKTRFIVDGLKRQRLDSPMLRQGDEFVPCTWLDAFSMIKTNLEACSGSEIKAFIGDLVDVEAAVALKDFLNKLGCSSIESRQDNSKVSSDLRSEFLFNSGIPCIDEADHILLVGTNPRMESPVLNARIRKCVVQGKLKVSAIGDAANLNYHVDWLGESCDTFVRIAEGRHPYCSVLANAKKPLLVIGNSAFSESSTYLKCCIRELSARTNLISDSWNGINILQTAAGRSGNLDIGAVQHCSVRDKPAKFVYLLGADDFDVALIPDDAFVVYQGHHGDQGAQLADVVLSTTAYTEKNGTYVNTDGRTQQTQTASSKLAGARDDWQAIRALSEVIGVKLSYNTINDLRNRVYEISPHLQNVDGRECTSYAEGGFANDATLAVWSNVAFKRGIKNFFMTDPISRASGTMAEASAAFPNSRESYRSRQSTAVFVEG